MSDRPWYHLGHANRAVLANVVVALVALAVLMENVRPRDPEPREDYRLSWNRLQEWKFGWPATWGITLEERGTFKPTHAP